ncbi:TEL2-interacting protein 1 [Branchiostoma belcheri]|nr:TEL2-interacting protein 1 [Branchiostoma belcheri]
MPKDQATNDFLVSQIHNRYPPFSMVWFGLTDQVQEGFWVWEDGTPLAGWSDWGFGQPSNVTADFDCAWWEGFEAYKWMSESTKEAFRRLRPVCVRLTKEQTVENVLELRRSLEDISGEDLQQLQEYALFPLRILLKQNQRAHERLTQAGLECMTHVFQHTHVHHWDMLEDTFTQLCVLLSSPANNGQVADLSEELKLAVVTTLKSLLLAADSSLLVSLYSMKWLPVIGHAVSVLLSAAEQESARKLRLETLECLMVLAGCHSDPPDLEAERPDLDPSVKRQMADSFASFLPGITMTLSRVIMGDVKQGHAVTVAATEAWSRIVAMVMSDSSLGDNESQQSLKSHDTDVSERLRSLQVRRTEEWCSSTAEKLKVLVQRIAGVVTHPNWRVRLALVEFAERLLMNCTKSLACCTSPLLQVLVSQVGDDYPQVADRCRQVLGRYSEAHLGSQPLVEILEENLHSLATSLPRLMRTADDGKKLTTLTLTHCYLEVLFWVAELWVCVSVCPDDGKKLTTLTHGYLEVLFWVAELWVCVSVCPDDGKKLMTLTLTHDDGKKLSTLTLTHGYLRLLGPRMTSLLNSAPHLRRLSLALVQVLELDVTDVNIVGERTPGAGVGAGRYRCEHSGGTDSRGR